MIALLLPVAGASDLQDLAPLPACADDAFPLTMLQRVIDLRYEDDGTLWVIDAGSLTRRAPDLNVVETPVPGAGDWFTVHQDHGPWVARAPSVDWHSGIHRWRLGDNRVTSWDPRPAAVARHDGLLAHADRWLLQIRAPGRLVAEQALVDGAQAVGTHEGRLFTVQEGGLRVWDGDGPHSVLFPGDFSGATSTPRGLLLVGRGGQLSLLDDGNVRPVGRVPGFSDGSSVQLVAVDRWIVAGGASEDGVVLVVLDPKLRVRAERTVASEATRVEAGIDQVILGEQAFSLPHLEPSEVRRQGPGLSMDGAAVRAGTWDGRRFVPAGLPPRPAPATALQPYAVPFGDNGLIVADQRPGGHPVQVVCFQPGEPALVDPGRLADRLPVTDPPRSRTPRDRRPLETEAPTLHWSEPYLDHVPAGLLARDEQVVVTSQRPAPDDLPAHLTWERVWRPPVRRVWLYRDGVEVWSGISLPPDVLPSREPEPRTSLRPDPLRTLRDALYRARDTRDPARIREAAQALIDAGASVPFAKLALIVGSTLDFAPPGRALLLVDQPSVELAWELADQLDIPVYLVDDRDRPLPRGLGHLPRRDRLTGIPPRSLVLVDEGRVTWTGTRREDVPLNPGGEDPMGGP